VHMNPVLLKPQSEIGAQVVVQGRVRGTAKAAAYQTMKRELLPCVLESFTSLRKEADIVLVEGAGSASEVNLRANDIANMGFACAADVPVVIVGDIERGGVIANLVGTKMVIAPDDAARVRGFLINKFRGDPALFAPGMTAIAQATGWEALGLIPFFADARLLPPEDALALEQGRPAKPRARRRIAALILPHIANFDDLDPLDAEPSVDLVRLRPGMALPGDIDLVILPGSKATIADLAALRGAGFDVDIAAHRRRGGRVLGLCGGYQMLGRAIDDGAGIEGAPGKAAGLGLLDVETILTAEKTLEPVRGETSDRTAFTGYEMHMGATTGADCMRPFAHRADGSPEGAVSADGLVMGTYIHGLFADDRQRAAWLGRLAAGPCAVSYEGLVEETLDRLAAHIASHVDLDRLMALAK
jgi:adenosylcobyric acid synthase